jgi:hypothetical protein
MAVIDPKRASAWSVGRTAALTTESSLLPALLAADALPDETKDLARRRVLKGCATV